MENSCLGTFEALDYGSKPNPVKADTVDVMVSAGLLVNGYAKAFVNEARRVNPALAEMVDITVQELTEYCEYLLYQRVQIVHEECKDYRKLKSLWIPSYVQYVLRQVGKVDIFQYGLELNPVVDYEPKLTFEQALQISDKIGAFRNDLQMVLDAMPRDVHGSEDVMSCALVSGYVRSIREVKHVASTYVAAFANLQLRKESAFQVLYRVQYDDLDFIARQLTRETRLF